MRINPNRLLNLLEGSGFRLIWAGGPGRGSVYERPSIVPDLSESIYYMFAGKRHEAVGAAMRVTIWNGFPCIGEDRHIPDVATDSRGYAIVATDADAIAWERHLAEVGPRLVAAFAHEVGPRLLERTRGAREAVVAYLAAVEGLGGTDALARTANRQQIEAAERLIDSSLVTFPELLDLYRTAALAIVRFRDTVEKDQAALDGNNLVTNTDLSWRIDLLVNRLNSTGAVAAHT